MTDSSERMRRKCEKQQQQQADSSGSSRANYSVMQDMFDVFCKLKLSPEPSMRMRLKWQQMTAIDDLRKGLKGFVGVVKNDDR